MAEEKGGTDRLKKGLSFFVELADKGLSGQGNPARHDTEPRTTMTDTRTQTQKVDATQNSASGQKVDATGQSDATRAAAAGATTGQTDTRPSKGGAAPTTGATATAKAPKAPKAPKAEGEAGRGRKSQYSGMLLKATVETNNRRENSHGHKSLAIILAAGKAGISYEDYIAKGGRLNDLVWDINKDNVVAEKPKA